VEVLFGSNSYIVDQSKRGMQLRSLMTLFLFGLCGLAHAEKACSLDEYQAGERPVPTVPTKVHVVLTLADILDISDVEQNVTMDGMLFLRWHDPRLAHLVGCRFPMDAVWHPGMQLINSGQLSRRQAFEIDVTNNGWIEGRFRVFGSVANPRYMPDFPFDAHQLRLDFTSVRYNAMDVVFVVDESQVRQRANLTVPDWEVGQATLTAQVTEMSIARERISVVQLTIPVQRYSRYFVYKIVLPLIIIVMMSWSVFWVDPRNLGPQMALAATSMLTLITFQFTMNDLLPRIGYFTQLDTFILSSSLLVFLALIEAVMTGYLVAGAKEALARRIDQASRIGFPVVFLLVILLTLVL
jgi:gamma-aminobutyric acid receptor subunit beta